MLYFFYIKRAIFTLMTTLVNTITTISELEDALSKGSEYGYLNTLKAANIPYEEFEKFFTWDDTRYTRNRVISNGNYELLVICWEKGQDSPIYDFNSQSALIHTLRGKLTEEKFIVNDYNELECVSSVSLGVNDFSYISGHVGLHRYMNFNDGRTVSLVFYNQPLKKWNEYDPITNTFSVRQVYYDS